MSRIIVKNLPDFADTAQIKQKFQELGRVTDVQLKYTKSGKFRKFGFIGYENEADAKAAIEHFNKTYIGTSQIQVELCSDLGDTNKPRAWSKYATESSTFKKLNPNESAKENRAKEAKLKEKKEKKKKKGPIQDEELVEQLKKHKDDHEFMQFMELHGKVDKLVGIDSDEEEEKEVEEGKKENVDEEESKKLANDKGLSDLEYLKAKMKGTAILTEPKQEKTEEKPKFFTLKISNLPYKAKRKDIEEMLHSVHIDSLRLPKQKGIAFVGFKTEKQMKQALIFNKTFLNGHRIQITEHKKNKEEEVSSVPKKWQKQESEMDSVESIAESGRIFVRNLPYTVSEDDLQAAFGKFGQISELVYPVDRTTREHKGYALVTYLFPQDAASAFGELDGNVFHGRMLHLLPAKSKDDIEEAEDESSNFKKKKMKNLKKQSGFSHTWNSLFLDINAVADVIAEKYNATKEEVLTGSNAAVRMALAETQLVAETKQFLVDNGVQLDSFNQEVKSRSKTVILVKNLPAKTTASEIRELFIKYGELGRVILPPSGITGIVEFLEPSEAKIAFRKLAYSKFKHLPLYLEWAPEDSLKVKVKNEKDENEDSKVNVKKEEDEEELIPEEDTVLFVKNLNFDATEEDLRKHFEEVGKLASVTVARKKDPKKPGATLSMGYGFVQFYHKSALDEALKRLQGTTLMGHQLELKRSNRTLKDTETVKRKFTNMSKQTGTKILVRNIPFQATTAEISELFKTFGELKFVRLPKKLVGTGSHRGFAFVEFMTKQDAKRAMESLGQSTHLLGRRLVLEWAETEEDVNQLRIKTAKHFHQDSNKRMKFDSAAGKERDEEAEMEF
ncbi:probable RNA-binding protein 19 [Cimex lectularius]|uniref:RRM domain-containing protein n=1 Tax=Cimex lectularius TaxID=79782 RepID=A0A8I6RFP9_CIMLE|nr:probable RNA-binding protein 19 [Cimex lectularius]